MSRGLLAATVFAFAPLTGAQAWPDKPITLIVNVGAGGAPDVLARMYGTASVGGARQAVHRREPRRRRRQPRRRGGRTRAPDGHTLLVSASSSFVIGPHIYKLNFDPVKDVTPVAAMARHRCISWCARISQAKNVAELIALRAAPIRASSTFGSAGIGTLPHVAAETLLHTAKIKAVARSLQGLWPALTGLLRGEVDFVFDPGVAIPQVKAGKARLLAVGSEHALAGLSGHADAHREPAPA